MAGMPAAGSLAGLGESRVATLILSGDRDVIFDRLEQDSLFAAVPGAVLKVYSEAAMRSIGGVQKSSSGTWRISS